MRNRQGRPETLLCCVTVGIERALKRWMNYVRYQLSATEVVELVSVRRRPHRPIYGVAVQILAAVFDSYIHTYSIDCSATAWLDSFLLVRMCWPTAQYMV